MPNLQTLKASVINKIIIDSKLQQSGQLQENTVLQRLYTVMTNVETCYCFQIQNFISELFNTLTNTFPVLAAVINSQEDFNKLLSAFVLKVYARYQSNREYLSKLVLCEVRYIRFPRVLFINSINKSKSHVHEHIASIDQIFEFSKSSYILMAYITGLSIQNSMSIDYSYLNTVMTTQHISLLQRFHYFVIEIDKINPDIKAQTHLYRYGLNLLAWQADAKLVLAGRFAQLKETSVSIRRAAQVDVTLLRHFLTNNIEIRQKQLAQLEIKKKKRFQQIIKAQQSESVLFTSLDGPQVKKLTNILLKYSDNKLFSMKTNYEVESSQKYLNLSKAIYDLKSIQNKFNMTFITHTNQKISLFESSQPHSFKFVKQRRKQVAQRLIVQVENNLIKKDYEVDLFLKSQNEKILDVIINQTLYEEMQFQQNVQGMMFQGFMLFCLVNKITVNVAQVLFFQSSLNIPVNSQQIVSYDYTSMSQQQLFRLVFFCKLIQPQNPGKISAIIQKSTFSYIQQLEILFQKIYAKFADVAKSKTDLKAIFAVFSDIFHTIWKHESTALSFFKKFQTKQNIVQKLYNGVFGQNLKGQVDSLDVPQAINIINQSLNRSDNQNNNQVFYDIDGLSHQKNTQNNYNTKVNPKVNATNGVVLYRNDYGISTPRITQDTYFTKVNPQVNVTNGTTGINPYYGPAPANVDPDSNNTIENKNLSFQKSADIDVHVRETQKNQKLSGKSKQQISRTRRVVSKILTKKSKRDAQLAYQYTQLRFGVSLKQKELSDKNQTLNLRNIVNNLYDKKSKLKQDLVHLSNKQKQNIENIENKQKQLLQLNKQLKKFNDNYEEEKATLQQFQKQVEVYTRIRWQKPQNVPVLLIRVFQATNEVQRNKKISQMRQSISAKLFVSKSNGMATLTNIKTVEDKLTQLKLYRDVYKDQIQDQYKHAQAQVSLDINSYIKKGQILVKETLRQNVGLLQNSYEKDRQDNYFEIQKNMKDPKKIGQNKVVLEQYQYDQIANTLKLYENVFVKNMSLLEEYCQKSHNKLLMNQIREVKELYKRHYDIKKVLTLHQNPSLDKMSPKDLTYLQQLYKNLMDI